MLTGGDRSVHLRPLRGAGADPAAAAGELRPGLRAVEEEALAVEAVDALARFRLVERDHLDHVLPAQAADVEVPEHGLEPVAEPGVALAGVVLDPAADLAADGVDRGVPGEDTVVELRPGGDDEEGEIIHRLGRAPGAAEGLGDAGNAPRRLVDIRGV